MRMTPLATSRSIAGAMSPWNWLPGKSMTTYSTGRGVALFLPGVQNRQMSGTMPTATTKYQAISGRPSRA